tara:strand:+ start:1301 stop:2461 length:1161 start_codon:yes stop_codon:yes gene_type:complete
MSLDCIDCGKIFDEGDLAAGACQGCGEPFTPDTVVELNNQFGHVAEAPEIIAPVVSTQGAPQEIECANPDCAMPLMGDQMLAYQNGQGCPYCGHNKKAQSVPISVDIQQQSQQVSQNVSQSQSMHTGPVSSARAWPFYVNSGPLAKHKAVIHLPEEIIGRKFFTEALQAACQSYGVDFTAYHKALGNISREHIFLEFDVTCLMGDPTPFSLTDQGSTNLTHVNRDEVSGTVPFGAGQMLVIAQELHLSICSGRFEISHVDTGVSVRLNGFATEGLHLGRLQTNGQHEAFAKAVLGAMDADPTLDSDEYRRISRRHAHVIYNPAGKHSNTSSDSISVTCEPGKKATVLLQNATARQVDEQNPFNYELSQGEVLTLAIGKQQFTISSA